MCNVFILGLMDLMLNPWETFPCYYQAPESQRSTKLIMERKRDYKVIKHYCVFCKCKKWKFLGGKNQFVFSRNWLSHKRKKWIGIGPWCNSWESPYSNGKKESGFVMIYLSKATTFAWHFGWSLTVIPNGIYMTAELIKEWLIFENLAPVTMILGKIA